MDRKEIIISNKNHYEKSLFINLENYKLTGQNFDPNKINSKNIWKQRLLDRVKKYYN